MNLCAGDNGDKGIYPHGIIPKLDSARISTLRRLTLPEEGRIPWDSVRMCLYGDGYDKNLLDLVCHIDANGKVKTSLSKANKQDLQEVYGERFVYVTILSETSLDSTEGDSCSVARTVLGYERGPADITISGILQAVSSAVFGAGVSGTSTAESIADSKNDLRLLKYSDKGKTLYIGFDKFKIARNTKNRIVITPRNTKLPFRSINYSFGNFEKSFIGASVGMGYTQCEYDSLAKSDKLNLYVFAFIYFERPTMPVEKKFKFRSFWSRTSIVAGTNFASGTIFNNLAVGVRMTVLENVGIIIGGNYVLGMDHVRRFKPFCGVDYRL
jgi:hypothetical protein